jgi:hypothetical protein
MPDRTECQVQRTDRHGRSRPMEYCAVDVSGNGGMESSERKPMDTGEKTSSENPHDRNPLQALSRDPHTYRIPPGELPGGVGCRDAGAWRAWRAVQ